MANVKPAEVSAILRKELAGLNTEAELEEVGSVLQVGDGIARIYGLSHVQAGELIEFSTGVEGIVLNLEEDNVGAVLLGETNDIKEGDVVKRTNRIASLRVGEAVAAAEDVERGARADRVRCPQGTANECGT